MSMQPIQNDLADQISLKRQIECVRREIAMRERVYPSLVRRERMTSEAAAEEIATMRAILKSIASTRPRAWIEYAKTTK